MRLQAALAYANVGNSTGTAVALAALKDAAPANRQKAAQVLALVGDLKTGLPALNAAFDAEKDDMTRSVIGVCRDQLKARIGLPRTPVAEVKASSGTAKGAVAPKKKPAAKGAPKAPAKPAPKKKPAAGAKAP
jgi:hypothetical protein